MTEYEKIYRFENLYGAYKAAARWKNKTYHSQGYRKFMIYDPKKRLIQVLSFRDRVVQHSLCDNVLTPYFENRLVFDCAACRKNKGTHFATNRLSEFMREFYKTHKTDGYFLKCDVRKFFDSIDHSVLKYLLRKYLDKDILRFLYQIIDGYNAYTGKGLPMGNQSSQWFALYYLDAIDRVIKEKYKIKYYTRYMDDLILLHESKEYLQRCLAELTDIAENKLKISFNEKTQIFPVSEGVDYLGWRFYLTENGKVIRRLRTSNKRRFKRRLKAFSDKYSRDEMTLEEIQRSLASYRGHLSHGHTWRLRTNVFNNFVLTKHTQENITGTEPIRENKKD